MTFDFIFSIVKRVVIGGRRRENLIKVETKKKETKLLKFRIDKKKILNYYFLIFSNISLNYVIK